MLPMAGFVICIRPRCEECTACNQFFEGETSLCPSSGWGLIRMFAETADRCAGVVFPAGVVSPKVVSPGVVSTAPGVVSPANSANSANSFLGSGCV